MQKAGEMPPFPYTPPYHLCSQVIMCARVWNDVQRRRVPLFLESRAILPSLLSIFVVLPLSSALRVRSSSCLLPGYYTVI